MPSGATVAPIGVTAAPKSERRQCQQSDGSAKRIDGSVKRGGGIAVQCVDDIKLQIYGIKLHSSSEPSSEPCPIGKSALRSA